MTVSRFFSRYSVFITIRDVLLFDKNVVCWERFSFVVGATIYIGGSNNKQKTLRISEGQG